MINNWSHEKINRRISLVYDVCKSIWLPSKFADTLMFWWWVVDLRENDRQKICDNIAIIYDEHCPIPNILVRWIINWKTCIVNVNTWETFITWNFWDIAQTEELNYFSNWLKLRSYKIQRLDCSRDCCVIYTQSNKKIYINFWNKTTEMQLVISKRARQMILWNNWSIRHNDYTDRWIWSMIINMVAEIKERLNNEPHAFNEWWERIYPRN